MWKVKNRGSAVVELSIIMPIVLLIIVMIVRLFLILTNEAQIMENSYKGVYLFTVDVEPETMGNDIDSKIEGMLLGEETAFESFASVNSGNICYSINYNNNTAKFKTEVAMTAPRLRRWQLYGDVLQQ